MEKDAPFAQPNNGHLIFAALRDVLADLYPEENDARVVVDDTGLDAKQIPFSSRAQTNWDNILAEAIRQAHLDPLLKAALAAYGQYRLLIEQGGYLAAPASLPVDAGVTIAGDVNLNQGDFVGRDKNVRSIIAGRDVIGSLLITGDHNQVFVGGYERLQDAYINPQSVFDRVDLAHFTGREWLLAKVDAFLQNYDRGYFILEANAGLGKTAFMAWLVKQRNYIHHFCALTPGLKGMENALKSLAAQLALAYELRPDGVLPSAATRPDFLYDLLVQAAQHRQPGEKIVVVIDALDEAGAPSNQNVLGLPTGLPEGVFFVVSRRPATTMLTIRDAKTRRRYYCLAAESADNQADMRLFLSSVSVLPEISQALQTSEHHYTAVEFIETLLAKCQGLWIYLSHVVPEIQRGERSPLDLAALPDGMMQYYVEYWNRWRDADEAKWEKRYLPLLAMLAAAQEAIPCQHLIEWSGVKITEQRLRRLLEERWRPFLVIDKKAQLKRYRFYHATLQEFCEGRVDQNSRSPQPPIVEDLAKATCAAHHRLVDRYWAIWGGLEDGLPGLQDHVRRDLDDRYGLRHLVAHLESAGRIDELHHLLRVEWVRREAAPSRQGWHRWWNKLFSRQQTHQPYRSQNIWYAVREAVNETDGYLADVNRAWRLAEKHDYGSGNISKTVQNYETVKERANNNIGLQCRYALIIASFNSLSKNIEPQLLTELVKNNIWLPQEGLAYARHVKDHGRRVEMLMALVTFLAGELRGQIIEEALSIALAIQERSHRVETLIKLISQLPRFCQDHYSPTTGEIDYHPDRVFTQEIHLAIRLAELGYPDQAIALVQDGEPGYFKDKRITLTLRLAELGYYDHALIVSRTITSKDRLKALFDLALLSPAEQREQLLEEILTTVLSIFNDDLRSENLAILVPHLSIKQLQNILAATHANISSATRSKIFAILALRFTQLGEIGEALIAARSIQDHLDRIDALLTVASLDSEKKHVPLLHEALDIAQAIEDGSNRLFALLKLLPYYSDQRQEQLLQEAIGIALTIEDRLACVSALFVLIPHCSKDRQEQLLHEILSIALALKDSSDRDRTLHKVAADLAKFGYPHQTFTAALAISDTPEREKFLINLAHQLVELHYPDQALAMIQAIIDSFERDLAMINLASHLMDAGYPELALITARSVNDNYHYTQALLQLILCFPKEKESCSLMKF
ncbi:MAG: effector-associated domain EAD1-containing protein [Caldilineaceae bacterium]